MMLYISLPLPMLFLPWVTSDKYKWVTLTERRRWRDQRGFPPIHAYNVLNLGLFRFIVDLDADPFHGTNTGVVVAPLAANVPIYNQGFVYHTRSCASGGEIVRFSCMLFDDMRGPRVYMDGDGAERISIVPYQFESG